MAHHHGLRMKRGCEPYNGREPYIFISYSHRDNGLLIPVLERMIGDGYRLWYDEGIDPGTEWDANIAEHIESCGYFIAFISENYLASENCKDELSFARELDKQRLLVYLGDVKLPSGMRMRLGRLQAIHMYTYSNADDFYDKLYSADRIVTCQNRKLPEEAAQETEEVSVWPVPKTVTPVMYASEAEKKYRAAAEAGDTEAQYHLGLCFDFADGVQEDKSAAFAWYRRAAEQGHADSQFRVGWFYSFGDIFAHNYAEAVKWYRRAAEQGNVLGQFFLANCYKSGTGVAEDAVEAFRWYQRAAENGYAEAQFHLGNCYYYGLGVSKELEHALFWYHQAAEQGSVNAQYWLANCYRYGWGVPKSETEANRWYRLAAEQGYEPAEIQLKSLGIQ